MRPAPHFGSGLDRIPLRIIGAAALGVVLFGVGVALSEVPLKRLIPIAGAISIGLAGIATGRTKQFLLFAWVASLPYNRNYFFDALDIHGSYGPYWIPSDVFLFALLGLWAYESAVLKIRRPAIGRSTALWVVPLVLAGLASAVNAPRPDWTGFEMLRMLRMVIVFWYLRYNLDYSGMWACFAGFGVATLYQVLTGVYFVATGTSLGLASLLGTAGGDLVATLQFLSGADAGMRRAQGTLGHPNTLAVYLLLIAPMFVSLGLAMRHPRLRFLFAGLAIAAIIGVAVTLSRTSWVIIIVQCVALLAALTALRFVNVKQSLGLLIVGGFVSLMVLVPFTDKIYQRLTGDFSNSIEFRARHDKTALKIWSTSPITGVGLNNYSDILGKYEYADVAVHARYEEVVRKIWEVRITSWVHNIYLLFLAETGFVGLGALLFYFTGIVVMGIRAVRHTSGTSRLISLGLLVGVFGLLVHGIQESVFWIDPITYTVALIAALLNNLPNIKPDGTSFPVEPASPVSHA